MAGMVPRSAIRSCKMRKQGVQKICETVIPAVYTGTLDELFGSVYGNLPYRSLRFEWKHTENDSLQPAPVVAYPQEKGYTRITEYKKPPIQQGNGSSYAVEYPLPYREGEKLEPYYPVLTTKSQEQYAQYKALANRIPNLILCGRLADFKYYDMDQALERVLEVSRTLNSGMIRVKNTSASA